VKAIELNARLRKVRLVIFDVDGVLTDGTILLGPDGREMKAFNVLDGTGIKYLQRAGLRVALLSGRRSSAVRARARELGIDLVVQGAKVKMDGFAKLLQAAGVTAEESCVVGDDLPDIPVMREAGVGVAVADARDEVLGAADWVTRASGGRGAAREVAEKLLKVQGKWKGIMSRYLDANGRRGKGGRV
jgi:3-deoxy-D-manno-octulosonate 8-phosphate phosphatase (KDO 8-P phosphatase)